MLNSDDCDCIVYNDEDLDSESSYNTLAEYPSDKGNYLV